MKAFLLPAILAATLQNPVQASHTVYDLDCGTLQVSVTVENLQSDVELEGITVSKDFESAEDIESTQDGLKITWARADGSQDVLSLKKTGSTSLATFYEGSLKSSTGLDGKGALDLKVNCTQ